MRTASLAIAALSLFTPASSFAQSPKAVAGARPPVPSTLASPFLVKPYLQLGHSPGPRSLALLWHAADRDAEWSVDYRPAAQEPWRRAETPSSRRLALPGVEAHRIYQADLLDLVPGGTFSYRVRRDQSVVFTAEGRACKAADQPYRFVSFGDCGDGTPEQKAIAHRAYLERPDFVMIPGDIVYSRGRVSEYRTNFWPVYNADTPSPALGAPLLRSTLFLAAPGNHDIASRDLFLYPDSLAYFLYWAQPLNGPEADGRGPSLRGMEATRQAFLDASAGAYPRMANYSFDYANAHWTILDSNPYVDWTDAPLRSWLEHDLAAARGATWRFVVFHHPGFQSARTHFREQQMRRIAGILEAGGVDLVLSGHVHNYQRTYPLRFETRPEPNPGFFRDARQVPGHWTLDKSFDGRTRTHPDGVIYLVTGAGGAELYNRDQDSNPASWQEFTSQFRSVARSLTVADVEGSTLTVRQVGADGGVMDEFVVTK